MRMRGVEKKNTKQNNFPARAWRAFITPRITMKKGGNGGGEEREINTREPGANICNYEPLVGHALERGTEREINARQVNQVASASMTFPPSCHVYKRATRKTRKRDM